MAFEAPADPALRVGPGPRAPTYYHWAMDKPCTTNQTYGYLLREELAREAAKRPHKVIGPFDYARPFSNSGFFPQIPDSSARRPESGLTKSQLTRDTKSASPSYPSGSVRKFDINRGYTIGHVPISSRVIRRKVPVDVHQERANSAPAAFRYPVSKSKDLYLWHSLAGCLVHVKNHPAYAGPAY